MARGYNAGGEHPETRGPNDPSWNAPSPRPTKTPKSPITGESRTPQEEGKVIDYSHAYIMERDEFGRPVGESYVLKESPSGTPFYTPLGKSLNNVGYGPGRPMPSEYAMQVKGYGPVREELQGYYRKAPQTWREQASESGAAGINPEIALTQAEQTQAKMGWSRQQVKEVYAKYQRGEPLSSAEIQMLRNRPTAGGGQITPYGKTLSLPAAGLVSRQVQTSSPSSLQPAAVPKWSSFAKQPQPQSISEPKIRTTSSSPTTTQPKIQTMGISEIPKVNVTQGVIGKSLYYLGTEGPTLDSVGKYFKQATEGWGQFGSWAGRVSDDLMQHTSVGKIGSEYVGKPIFNALVNSPTAVKSAEVLQESGVLSPDSGMFLGAAVGPGTVAVGLGKTLIGFGESALLVGGFNTATRAVIGQSIPEAIKGDNRILSPRGLLAVGAELAEWALAGKAVMSINAKVGQNLPKINVQTWENPNTLYAGGEKYTGIAIEPSARAGEVATGGKALIGISDNRIVLGNPESAYTGGAAGKGSAASELGYLESGVKSARLVGNVKVPVVDFKEVGGVEVSALKGLPEETQLTLKSKYYDYFKANQKTTAVYGSFSSDVQGGMVRPVGDYDIMVDEVLTMNKIAAKENLFKITENVLGKGNVRYSATGDVIEIQKNGGWDRLFDIHGKGDITDLMPKTVDNYGKAGISLQREYIRTPEGLRISTLAGERNAKLNAILETSEKFGLPNTPAQYEATKTAIKEYANAGGEFSPKSYRMKDVGDFVSEQERLIDVGMKTSSNPVRQLELKQAKAELDVFKTMSDKKYSGMMDNLGFKYKPFSEGKAPVFAASREFSQSFFTSSKPFSPMLYNPLAYSSGFSKISSPSIPSTPAPNSSGSISYTYKEFNLSSIPYSPSPNPKYSISGTASSSWPVVSPPSLPSLPSYNPPSSPSPTSYPSYSPPPSIVPSYSPKINNLPMIGVGGPQGNNSFLPRFRGWNKKLRRNPISSPARALKSLLGLMPVRKARRGKR